MTKITLDYIAIDGASKHAQKQAIIGYLNETKTGFVFYFADRTTGERQESNSIIFNSKKEALKVISVIKERYWKR